MTELKEKYQQEIVPALMQSLGFKNRMQVPRLLKISVNMGFNSAMDKDGIKACCEDLARITGQRPVVTRARKSISNFKLRLGMPVGAKVTLRGNRMYEFLARLIHATLPRIRDFRGLSAGGFDGRGSYTFGLREQAIFPEIDPDSVKRAQGMDITVVTSAGGNRETRELLARLGIPFAKSEKS
jgi:large subunit ribosomal protein L5